ncbi:Glycosyltransferase [Synechococcus sp. RCC307]|nr:Glycosyltransferase [Synechococcus sp. RCC307]
MTKYSFVILTCSSPWHGRGGASRVISSYIDFYTRKKVPLKICLFHFMHKYRLFRVLPSLKSLFYALTLLFCRQPYAIHHHHTSLYDLGFLFLFKLFSFSGRDRIAITLHNPKHFVESSSLFRTFHFSLVRFCAKHLHFLNSQDQSTFTRNHFLCLPIFDCVSVVSSNPLSNRSLIELRLLLDSDTYCLTDADIYLGVMAVLRPGKRIDLCIKALVQLPPTFKLLIAGEGSDMQILIKLVQSLNLSDRVQFLGWLDDDQKPCFFSQVDLFLNASQFDTQSLVFLESLTHSTPVISVPNPIFLEIYPPSPCIYYSSAFTVEAFSKAVQSAAHSVFSFSQTANTLLERDSVKVFPFPCR